jgi:hypothetical protein
MGARLALTSLALIHFVSACCIPNCVRVGLRLRRLAASLLRVWRQGKSLGRTGRLSLPALIATRSEAWIETLIEMGEQFNSRSSSHTTQFRQPLFQATD